MLHVHSPTVDHRSYGRSTLNGRPLQPGLVTEYSCSHTVEWKVNSHQVGAGHEQKINNSLKKATSNKIIGFKRRMFTWQELLADYIIVYFRGPQMTHKQNKMQNQFEQCHVANSTVQVGSNHFAESFT
jgi:hypothetical protein